MLVEAIYNDAKEVLGFCNDAKIFSRLTDAVEALSNKGQWDSQLTYLDITTTGDNDIIALPEFVDAVLRLNINGSPAFARDRYWEFTLDGPGSNDARIGFQWEDRGDVVQIDQAQQNSGNTTSGPQGIEQQESELPGNPLQPPFFIPNGSYGITFPLRVTMYCRDPRNRNAFLIYTTDGSDPDWNNGTRGGRVVRLNLNAETTVKAVCADEGHRPNERRLSTVVTEFYSDAPPPDPNPPPVPPPGPPPGVLGQRYIRLSQKAVAVRALVRIKPKPISSLNDWIPLDSKLAILLMLKANESYRRGTSQDFQLGQAQEQQALTFLQQEQQSRSEFVELAKAMDQAPMVGYTYHANSMVVVSDIYDEASEISGGVGKDHVFDRISEAIEVLANKGQWDGMTAYLDMVPGSDVIGLPRQVEVPIRINIEKRPSLSRDRMFEFSTNGPGTDLDEVTNLTWEDQGEGSLMIPLQNPSPISVQGPSDIGALITIYGIDVNDKEQIQSYAVPAPDQFTSAPIVWKTVTRVTKPVTQGPISIFANDTLVAFMYPDETETNYRIIKFNKKPDAIKVMFRKQSLKVSSTDDIIPLKSRSAILTMMRALKAYKAPDINPVTIQAAQALEAQALKFMQEEERSRLAYIAASARDMMPALGTNTNSQGVVIVQDVYDDAADIFGPVSRQILFDKITEAMEILANKSQWDGLDGYVDVVTDQRGYMTLPRRVEMIQGMNFFRTPAQARNKWYEFHMNGLGTDPVRGDYYDDLGEYPTIISPTQAVNLFAQTSWSQDSVIKVRAYGYDNAGNWVRSIEDDEFVDGELVPLTVVDTDQPAIVPATVNSFRQITRITKEESVMPIRLFGTASLMLPYQVTGSTDVPTPAPNPQLLGIYESDEVEPSYRRIRIPTYVTWARMRYRLRTMKVNKMSDVLNMKSKTALVTMMRGLKALEKGDLNAYQGFEATAVKLISEEQMSRNPAETFSLEFDTRTCFADPLQGQY